MGLWPSQPLKHLFVWHLLDRINKLLQDLSWCVGNRTLPLVIISNPPTLRQLKHWDTAFGNLGGVERHAASFTDSVI